MGERRREARKKARELFELMDEDGNGTLDKAEVSKLATSLLKACKGSVDLDPPFDLDRDWNHMVMQTQRAGCSSSAPASSRDKLTASWFLRRCCAPSV